MEDAEERDDSQAHGYELNFPWSYWLIGYVKRKLQNRKAKYDQERPTDRAARITAKATNRIAYFTVVLAAVSILQWCELHSSGDQTDKLISLYDKQARHTEKLAKAAKAQADAAKALADEAKAQTEKMTASLEKQSAQAVNTADLAAQAKRSANIAQDIERRQLRAYVLVNESSIKVDASNNIHTHVQFKNSGLTPAYKMAGWGCLIVGQWSFRDNMINVQANLPSISFDETSAPKSVIGPGDTKVKGAFPFCDVKPPVFRPLTPDERNRLRNGTAAIYVYGQETYLDAFGSKRFLRYRFFSNDMWGITTDGSTADDLFGNDAN